jgi:hypothetical protein
VNCEETTTAISLCPGNVTLPPEATAHIAACEHCLRLMRLFEGGPELVRPQSDRLNRIQLVILRDLRPVRPLAQPMVYVLTFALIFLAVLTAALARSGTASGWAAFSTGEKVAVFSVLGVSGALLTISLVRQMTPGSRDPVSPATLLAGIPVAFALAIALVFRAQHESEFLAKGTTCFRIGLSHSIPAALALWLVVRRGAMLRPWLTGMVLGGFAGLLGLTILEINCSDLNVFHLLVWHGGVVVASSLGGGTLSAFGAHIDSRINPRIV